MSDERLVPCPFAHSLLPCHERIKFKYLMPHCESNHVKVAVMKNGTTQTINKPLWKDNPRFDEWLCGWPVKIEAYGRVFITQAATKDQVFYQWVKLLGSPSEAKDFLFCLKYKGPRSTHAFFGEVSAIDDTIDDVISSGKSSSIGFTIFKNQFMENCNYENYATLNYSWSITIKKLDE